MITNFIKRTTGLKVRQGITLFALFLLVILTFKALYDPLLSFDSYAYHFPFSCAIWHIKDYGLWNLGPVLYPLWLGFPKFAETLQGAAWRLTSWQGAITFPHILLFGFYIWMMHKYWRLPLLLLILAVFACPMLMIHYIDSYIDLFCSLNLAIAFFGFTHALWRVSQANSKTPCHDYVIASIALIMASNSKFLSYFPAMILLTLVAWQFLFSKALDLRFKAKILAFLLLVSICCSIVPITNAIRFHNPFYPITTEINHKVIFVGTMGQTHLDEPTYPEPILNYPPIQYFLSASELDWAFRGVRTAYSNDVGFGDHPAYGPPARTGGWGGIYFLLMLALLGSTLFNLKQYRHTYFKTCLINFFILAFICTYLPRAFELRYSLYIPLIMIPLALKMCLVDRSTLRCAKIFIILFILFNFFHLDFEEFHLGLVNHHFEAKPVN